jgi:hypothetical protein
MTRRAVEDARPWFVQAQSDVRTAQAIHQAPPPMNAADVGCHVAAMCAQAIEKTLKGYVFLNGATPALDHRPDGYIVAFLRAEGLLRYPGHRGALSKLFDGGTRAIVTTLLDLTPGGVGNRSDVKNTEYPWTDGDRWSFAPALAPFEGAAVIGSWLAAAKRVSDTLGKLWIAVDRATL